jgi:hypothetical protein
VAFRRESKTLLPEKVLSLIVGYYGVEKHQFKRQQRRTPYRPVTAKILFRYCGMTQREIANFLGLKTGAAVSAQISKANEMERSNQKIKKDLCKLEKLLSKLKQSKGDQKF